MKAGFSKDTANTIGNILAIPTVISTFFFGKWTNLLNGRLNSMLFVIGFVILVDYYLVIFFPINIWIVTGTSFFTGIIDSWRFYLMAYMINDFPVNALTGMFITFMASFSNFGRQTSIHTWICGKLGWKNCAIFGLSLQVVILLFIPRFYNWVQEGNSSVPKEI